MRKVTFGKKPLPKKYFVISADRQANFKITTLYNLDRALALVELYTSKGRYAYCTDKYYEDEEDYFTMSEPVIQKRKVCF